MVSWGGVEFVAFPDNSDLHRCSLEAERTQQVLPISCWTGKQSFKFQTDVSGPNWLRRNISRVLPLMTYDTKGADQQQKWESNLESWWKDKASPPLPQHLHFSPRNQFSEFMLAAEAAPRQPPINSNIWESLNLQVDKNISKTPQSWPPHDTIEPHICVCLCHSRPGIWEHSYLRKSKQLNIVDEKWKWNRNWKNMLMEKYKSSSQKCDGANIAGFQS